MVRTFLKKSVISFCITIITFCITYYLTLGVSQTQSEKVPKKSETLLFIGIVSAPVRLGRRQAIRETWNKNCTGNNGCVLKFITDAQSRTRRELDVENRLHNDLALCPTPPGLNYARRYLWWIDWAMKRYKPRYILRIDDDYFICINKLILELSFYRPRTKFVWGWLHCAGDNKIFIDQGFLLISQDIVENLLERRNSLLCHPLLDQAFGMWMNDYPGLQTFGDNKRLYHHGLNSKNVQGLCSRALAVHKSYPAEMRMYWNVTSMEETGLNFVPPVVFPCSSPLKASYKAFTGIWYYEAKPCKDDPDWGKGQFVRGRQLGFTL